MKFTFAIPTFLLSMLLSCNINADGNKIFNIVPKQGKGPITDKTYNLEFDKIKVAQSIQAEVIKSDSEKVIISAPSDLMDDILVENSGGELYIHFKPGINISADRVKAKIFAKDFSGISASSSADIKIKDQFTQDKTSVKASSSGSISGDLEANDFAIDVSSSGSFSGKVWAVNLSAEASSSGDININGKAKNADFDVSSSGSLNAKDLVAENAILDASSSGSMQVSVSGALNASASSSGSVDVFSKGNLQITSQKESSGGSVSVH